jgi:pimeloyl-ACP methyl ester carboxylesterase
MKLLLIVTILAVFAGDVRAADSAPTAPSRKTQNGAILSTEEALPHATYELWLDAGRKEMLFDEARFGAEYPPEKFNEYKEKMHFPFATYEEWIAQMKRRSASMQEKWKSIEAETRRTCPPELFREFKETVDCSRIFYASDGLRIEGFILKPRTAASGRYPVIIYNHGGNSQLASLDDTRLLHLAWLVKAGYVVVASQYRGCGGSEGRDEIGGADVADVLNLIPLIESLPYADPAKVGMLGWSRGGMMAYLALAKTGRIAAAVIGSAPTDFFAETKKRPTAESLFQRMVPGYAEHRDEALKARSAQYWSEKLCKTTPILVLHGSDDQRCVPESALEMSLRLQQCRQPFRLVFFESGSHGLAEHQQEVNRQTLLWFAEYLARESPQR